MKNEKMRFSVAYIVIGLLVLWVLQSQLSPTLAVTKIPYSEFKKMVRSEAFDEVEIGNSKITGIIRDEDEDRKNATKKFEAQKVDDPTLVEELEEHNVRFSATESGTWLERFFFVWILPFIIFFFIWRFIAKRMGPGTGLMAVGKSKAKVYIDKDTCVSFNDVAGVDEAKEELEEVIDYLQNPQKYQRLGGKIPKGVLLVGPPGTGKTLLAKAVAGEAKVPFFSISGSSFVEMFVGVGASRVRDLFTQAQEKAPCIIFIDELDALGKARASAPISGGHEEREQTLNQLLVEMDGFDTQKGVIIMAATNRPEILDHALLRPGRFDRQILVDRPDIKGREEILRIHSKDVTLSENVELKVLAARTPGFVGSDLANVVNEAALLAARMGENAVKMDNFEEAINRVVAGLEKKKRVMNKKEQEIIAYHESGHALIAESVPNADKVHRVSIIPRGIAALGYTLQLPTEDRYLLTRSELLDRLAVLLGGRVAEEIVYNEASTGAQNDLGRATNIARSMVKEYGMSERIGPLSFENGRRSSFLMDMGFQGSSGFSEDTAKEIDVEVKKLILDAHNRVRKIIEEKKDKLEKLAKLLLEKEVVDSDELKKVLSEDAQEQPAGERGNRE